MAPGTSEFEGSDQRLPAGAHAPSDARHADVFPVAGPASETPPADGSAPGPARDGNSWFRGTGPRHEEEFGPEPPGAAGSGRRLGAVAGRRGADGGRHGRVLDASRDGRDAAAAPFPAELRGLLGTEMSLHRPDSDQIRRRIAAATGHGPYLGPFPAPTVFTPYDGTEGPAVGPSTRNRPELAAVVAARHARPIDLDDGDDPAGVVIDRPTGLGRIRVADRSDSESDFDGSTSPADPMARGGRLLQAVRFPPDDHPDQYDQYDQYDDDHDGQDGQDEPAVPLAAGDGATPDRLAATAARTAVISPAGPGLVAAPDGLAVPTEAALDHRAAGSDLHLRAPDSPAPLYTPGGGRRSRHRGRRPSRRSEPAASRPKMRGRRRGLVGAVGAVLGLTTASALALFGMPGSNSLDPSTSTVTAPPHPSASSWTSTTGTPTRLPTTPSATPAIPPGDGVSDRSPAPPTKSSTAPGTSGSRPAGASHPAAPAAGVERAPTPEQTGIYTATTARFPAGSRVQLPAAAADWVLFGSGWEGVQARAALPIPLLKTLVVGTPVSSASGFDWIGGFPAPFGVNQTGRLSVRGSATVSTYVLGSRELQIYLGSPSGQARITVGSVKDSRSFVVSLPAPLADGSSDALITLTLPAGIGATTVSIAGVGSAPWTLAAVVLR
ncbi:hypothetical protein [Frankia sp. AgB32]|uniref:hypothetical protein n=1 Tax=Frankia sp. AgB32 TaxID=631119 RepID=UPI00200C8E25|nr:hypothetical protein [Frankia sp. AgB32]MCK9895124.1 hypothetical protein [Frankia sp. AgB32]